MTRTEHLEWTKKRALEYCDRDDLSQAFASLMSDLRKHPELENHSGINIGSHLFFGGYLNTVDEMRKWINGFASIVLLVLALAVPAWGQTVDYDFEEVEITVPGHPDCRVSPLVPGCARVWVKDISKKGLLVMTFWNDAQGQPLWGSGIVKLKGRSRIELFFDCSAEAMNDAGVVAGNSPGGPCVRYPSGQVITLAGVQQATAFGISTDNRVSGQECVPNGPPNFGCTNHGFIWKDGVYTRIDFLLAPGTKAQLHPFAPNKLGQIFIEYYLSSLQNETFEHGFCIWDNGSCGTPFALSFEWRGGAYFFGRDMNDDGQVPFVFTPNDGTPHQLKLYDEGFLDITGFPSDRRLLGVEGIGNDGSFVVRFAKQVGTDFFGPIYEPGNAIATPTKRVGKR